MPKFEDYEIIKRFKSGAMGKTFLVKHKKTGVLYVMKRVDYSDEEDKKLADDEAEQMKRLNSRFTVKLICTFTDRMDLCLILEYCPGGDLRKFISELQKFPIKERIERVWNLMAQIAEALDFMHLNKVIHRDIKPENIFLMNDGSIRLGDFGLAKALTEKYYATVAGTKFYLAPEVWLQKIMTYLSDIYAFGVVTFELLAVHHPFLADNEQEMIEKIKKGESEQLPDWVPIKMKEQIMRMIDVV
ncbi:MAG: putative NEK protein kinase [Streblomastix strix]|uniref:non-specific serine/threonine protein kinase n=1 Tax=Streblomastix strix TaxID=222440 RepID=A0A5J4X264_9EUKA|nr:MAG: putative NEK protein kinase [Streblomastix strix]